MSLSRSGLFPWIPTLLACILPILNQRLGYRYTVCPHSGCELISSVVMHNLREKDKMTLFKLETKYHRDAGNHGPLQQDAELSRISEVTRKQFPQARRLPKISPGQRTALI